ncbi:MAG: TetR/AcrR family transcriptional regulator [Acidobacteriia bacterium]|nr:TetR/AcrR family transcriptional regulator [Terriglobia bacterium]
MSRTRSERAHEEALSSALKLIAEHGIDGVSVDAIAEHSGVSKATIYKHWANKDALCLEAIGKLQHGLPPENAGEDARAGVVELLRHLAQAPRPRKLMRLLPKIFGHVSRHPQFLKAWRERIEAPRRLRVVRLIERAIAAGELRADLDMDLAVHLLFGPVLYHRLMLTSAPPGMPEQIVDAFWRAFAGPRGLGNDTLANRIQDEVRNAV